MALTGIIIKRREITQTKNGCSGYDMYVSTLCDVIELEARSRGTVDYRNLGV